MITNSTVADSASVIAEPKLRKRKVETEIIGAVKMPFER